MNALTHGLSARLAPNPLFVQQSRQLALVLCGGQEDEVLFEKALKIAEYHHVLHRVRTHRMMVIEGLSDPMAIAFSKNLQAQSDLAERDYVYPKLTGTMRSPIYENNANLRKKSKYEPLLDRDEIQMMKAASRDLGRIERYERRAWSRLNRAIRDFIATRALKDSETPIA